MKIILSIFILLVITGCSSTRVVDRDFQKVIMYLENRYKLEFSNDELSTVYPDIGNEHTGIEQAIAGGLTMLFCGEDIEVKSYETNKILKLKLTRGLLEDRITKITLSPTNLSQTKIKAKTRKEVFLLPLPPIFRDKEYETIILQELAGEISGTIPPKETMTGQELGDEVALELIAGMLQIATNQNTSISSGLSLPGTTPVD